MKLEIDDVKQIKDLFNQYGSLCRPSLKNNNELVRFTTDNKNRVILHFSIFDSVQRVNLQVKLNIKGTDGLDIYVPYEVLLSYVDTELSLSIEYDKDNKKCRVTKKDSSIEYDLKNNIQHYPLISSSVFNKKDTDFVIETKSERMKPLCNYVTKELSKDEYRIQLHHIYMDSEYMVSTNGHILFECDLKSNLIFGDRTPYLTILNNMVPVGAIKLLHKITSKYKGDIKIHRTTRHIQFLCDNVAVRCELVDVTFPIYHKIANFKEVEMPFKVDSLVLNSITQKYKKRNLGFDAVGNIKTEDNNLMLYVSHYFDYVDKDKNVHLDTAFQIGTLNPNYEKGHVDMYVDMYYLHMLNLINPENVGIYDSKIFAKSKSKGVNFVMMGRKPPE